MHACHRPPPTTPVRADDRGIAVVRNEIQDFASTRTIFRWGACRAAQVVGCCPSLC